ncbi:OmpA/MotB family protein [Nesterenkonia lutea]|uniref:Chemotaxis protein MotB n=1 Tax=Nesterenkonia lutea TaxID=272919 RepID=A0ABR9JFC1_9MICC|nr:flagellar motor protein MotB [Nesterenkonia lutea]MBE1524624.1 chemotaxis protein MotB [Nesterenkonia lutea]
MSSPGNPTRRSSAGRAQGGRRRSRAGSGGSGGHGGGDERWMASYMDMVTVLMCLFIVLYAMSTVDQDKYEQLRSSLATGFGTESSETVDTASGVVVPPERVGEEGPDAELTQGEQLELLEEVTDDRIALAQEEIDDLRALQRKLQDRLSEAGHEGSAEFVLDERGLTVRLVGAETFFDPNSSTLNDEGQEVIDAIAPVLAPTARFFEVGGHADVRRPVEPYPTNWELSASRATGVLRELVEVGGVDAAKIVSVGYGDAHPVDERLWQNRRVDVTVLSDEPEQIRELLPELAAGADEA